MILILLFGYGLSLDVTDVPVVVVLEDRHRKLANWQLFGVALLNARLVASMAVARNLIGSGRNRRIFRISRSI